MNGGCRGGDGDGGGDGVCMCVCVCVRVWVLEWKTYYEICRRSEGGGALWAQHLAHETAICHNTPIYNFTTDRKKFDRFSTDQHLSMLYFFFRKYRDKQFVCRHSIMKESVFVAQLPSDPGITVWRIVWSTTNCCFMSDILQAGKKN